jgi:integrase/recombinase XerD
MLQKQNPCLNVKWLKEEMPVTEAFTPTEISDIINKFKMNTYMEARNKLILMFFADTGLRNLELCYLMRSNIGETTIKIMGKGRKERHLPISPVLNKYLMKYRRMREQHFLDDFNGHDNLFLSFRGKPLTVEATLRVVKIAGERANVTRDIRISPHTIRHTYAQMMLLNGIDVYSLSRLLDHESINITKHYLQSMQDEQIVETAVRNSPLMNLK